MKLKFPERLKKPGYRYLAGIIILVVIVTAPRWGRAALHKMSYFHVRTIEIHGTRYLEPADVVARLRVDTLRSLFDDVAPLEARLRGLPQVAQVKITRRPPGTLVVTITENLPVALVPRGDGLQPYDSAGVALPIDPSQTDLNLPILRTADPQVLHLLGALHVQQPRIFDQISQIERDSIGNVVIDLTPPTPASTSANAAANAAAGAAFGNVPLRIRALVGVAPAHFQDIFPVESDLARRNERPVELDLRYRDQVIARLP